MGARWVGGGEHTADLHLGKCKLIFKGFAVSRPGYAKIIGSGNGGDPVLDEARGSSSGTKVGLYVTRRSVE